MCLPIQYLKGCFYCFTAKFKAQHWKLGRQHSFLDAVPDAAGENKESLLYWGNRVFTQKSGAFASIT